MKRECERSSAVLTRCYRVRIRIFVAVAVFMGSAGQATPAPAGRVIEIAVGSRLACALRDGGAVECWGQDDFDEAAERCRFSWNDTDYACHRLPTRVDIEPALHIAAGGEDACAVLVSGRVACWGYNLSGALGDGTMEPRHRPVVIEGLHDVVQVGTGGAHTCALDRQGAVSCWGRNLYGELGDGGNADRASPGPQVKGLTGVTQIAVGSMHTCALLRDGQVMCWGENGGQLGDGTALPRTTPVRVRGLPPVVEVAASDYQTCARTVQGKVWCWGAIWWFVPDMPMNGVSARPREIAATRDVRQLALGMARICTRVGEAGHVECWGIGGFLGNDSLSDERTPLRLPALDGTVQVAAAWNNTCVLDAAGTVSCWGENDFGQVGDGTTETRSHPVKVGVSLKAR